MNDKRSHPIFIGGCDRSGTTLLGSLLGGHSHCLCTPESQFIKPIAEASSEGKDPADLVRILEQNWRFRIWEVELSDTAFGASPGQTEVASLLRKAVQAYGGIRARWVDHTPSNLQRASLLLQHFPGARFIHLVRDGRGVAASVIPLRWGPNNCYAAADWWGARTAAGLAMELLLGADRVLRVRFEDLVREPEKTLRAICAFTNLEFEPEMLENKGFDVPRYTESQHELVGTPVDRVRAIAWKKTLSEQQIRCFEHLAGGLLNCLGYELRFPVGAYRLSPWYESGLLLHECLWRFTNRFSNGLRKIRI